jgi:hypothetical protein
MTPVGFRLFLCFVAVLPLVLVLAASYVSWNTVARPWLFLTLGIVSLYALLGVVVVAAIFIGPGVQPYFLEASQPAAHASFWPPVSDIVAVTVFVALGAATLWGLKQWLSGT